MMRTVILGLLILNGACATSAWRSTWSGHPISEERTMTVLPDNARQDSRGLVFLRMLGLAPDDRPEFVCFEKPIGEYPPAGTGYTYVRAEIRSTQCPDIANASQLLVSLDASQKLLLPDLGIAIELSLSDGRAPYYTGPSLKTRLSDVQKVEKTSLGEIVITDASGAEVVLKHACCSDDLAFFQSSEPGSENRTRIAFEKIPPGRIVFAASADRRRFAFFIPSGDQRPQFFHAGQELARTNYSNLPVRAGLLILLPVVIAVDVITAPIQIVVVAIVAKQAIETVEKFPRCLWPG